jgi:hypothetical protein
VYSGNALHLGHSVVLMDKWDAEKTLELIERYRVTTSHMVPTQFHRMLLLPEAVRKKYDVSSLRCMIHAAAPCPPDVKRRMIEWWGNSVYEYYAATEGGGTLVTPQEWMKYPGTVGKAWPNAEIRILDDDGNDVPTGEQGTVYMKLGETGKFEYKGDAQKTKKNRIVKDDTLYFTVGDVGYLNEDGYLFLCDRKIDMIISGGANIYPPRSRTSSSSTRRSATSPCSASRTRMGRGDQGRRRARARRDRGRGARGRAARVLPRAARQVQAAQDDRLPGDAAARPERQAVQAAPARSLLGGQGARDLRPARTCARARARRDRVVRSRDTRALREPRRARRPSDVSARALALHQSSAVVDLHADSLLLRARPHRALRVGTPICRGCARATSRCRCSASPRRCRPA